MENLLENSYVNYFNFDLKKYHKNHSEYQTIINYFKDLKKSNITFNDDSKIVYDFIIYKKRLFLSNGIRAFPCGQIIKNAMNKLWVDIIVIPDGKTIITNMNHTDYSSTIIVGDVDFSIVKIIGNNILLLTKYIEEYQETFKLNDWASNERIRLLITLNDQITSLEKFNLLKKYNFLNPLQLTLGSYYYSQSIQTTGFLRNIILKNGISKSIQYFNTPKESLKLSESTLIIIKEEVIKDFVSNFSKDDVEDFLEIYSLENILYLNRITELHIEIILNIFPFKMDEFEYKIDLFKNFIHEKMIEINITKNILLKYYQSLKINLERLEEIIRHQNGYEGVGSLYSEKYIYHSLKKHFSELTILQEYTPSWLGRQRIDIYIEEFKIGIEYNGRQHYEPIEFFGGEVGFSEIRRRDELKKKLCLINDVKLIEIKYDEDLNESINKLIEMIKSYQ